MTQACPHIRIIVTGLIAQYPLGGVTWDYLQYVLGLHQMGLDVYYIEDTGQWPYNPLEGGLGKDCAYNVEYLRAVMSRFGLDDRWAYRFPWQSQWFGLSNEMRQEVIESADLLINVSGTLARPEDYRAAQRLAYVDSDPVFTQLKLIRGQADFRRMVDVHDVHFSFGENLSADIWDTGHDWKPTRQPVVLTEWHPEDPVNSAFTTVMNWTSYKPIRFQGKEYAQKDVEMRKYLDLPGRVSPHVLELAVNEGKTQRTPRDMLRHKGWRVVDPAEVCPDLEGYRRYIQTSMAEWSIAKGGYVLGNCGWFSCRSACYLAASRPVIVQDTGFSNVLPTGEGILAFRDSDQAVDAIHAVVENYQKHSVAARAIAEQCFDSRKVLGRLIEQAM